MKWFPLHPLANLSQLLKTLWGEMVHFFTLFFLGWGLSSSLPISWKGGPVSPSSSVDTWQGSGPDPDTLWPHQRNINATYHFHTNTTSTPYQHQLRKSHHKTISLFPFLKPIASYFKISFLFEREMYSKFVFTLVKSINLHRCYWKFVVKSTNLLQNYAWRNKNPYSVVWLVRYVEHFVWLSSEHITYTTCVNPYISLQQSKPNIGILVPNKNFDIWIWIWKSRSRKMNS